MVNPAATLAAHNSAGEAPIRIGPNAITRLGEATRQALGRGAECELFRRAGLERYLASPPQSMVDEREVIALHLALGRIVNPSERARISFIAGLLTGDYLLAHRIPKVAQVLLKLLPAGARSRVLTRAIGNNSWTFAGSGTFHAITPPRAPLRLTISKCPLCSSAAASEPLCDYYKGTFQRLFERIVSPRVVVNRTQCCAQGDDVCAFEINL